MCKYVQICANMCEYVLIRAILCASQGNMDVGVLHETTGSEEMVKAAVAELLKDVGTQNLIANLGEQAAMV